MRLAIVGGRDFNDEFLMAEHIAMFMTAYTNEELKPPEVLCGNSRYVPPEIEVISGGAKGADTLGARFAKINECPVTIFKPNWKEYGKAAGFIRNQTIVNNCDMVLAFWDGMSRGTADIIEKAKRAGKPTFIVYY